MAFLHAITMSMLTVCSKTASVGAGRGVERDSVTAKTRGTVVGIARRACEWWRDERPVLGPRRLARSRVSIAKVCDCPAAMSRQGQQAPEHPAAADDRPQFRRRTDFSFDARLEVRKMRGAKVKR
jgi:hypothetical protein